MQRAKSTKTQKRDTTRKVREHKEERQKQSDEHPYHPKNDTGIDEISNNLVVVMKLLHFHNYCFSSVIFN